MIHIVADSMDGDRARLRLWMIKKKEKGDSGAV